MTPHHFITAYKAALATQQWSNVEPLIHPGACITFSNGEVLKGVGAIRAAYERNFTIIKNEDYQMTNLHWVLKNDTTAVYIFDYSWKGTIHAQPAGGTGRGTAVIIFDEGSWKLMAEQLTKT